MAGDTRDRIFLVSGVADLSCGNAAWKPAPRRTAAQNLAATDNRDFQGLRIPGAVHVDRGLPERPEASPENERSKSGAEGSVCGPARANQAGGKPAGEHRHR